MMLPRHFTMDHPRRTLHGVALMVAATVCFSFMNVAVRQITMDVSPAMGVFLRNVLSLALMSTWVLHAGRQVIRTRRMKDHFIRAAIGVGSMELWFISLKYMPINEATALSFTTPMFVILLAAMFLKERPTKKQLLAVAGGMLGMLIILRPGSEALKPMALVVLASSGFIAASSIAVKSLTRTEAGPVIVFYMALYMCILSFPFAINDWSLPQEDGTWMWLLAMALGSTLAHLLMTEAYLRAEMVVLMPFDFTRLLFTAVLAWAFFGDRLDAWTALGGAVIVAASLLTAPRMGAKVLSQDA